MKPNLSFAVSMLFVVTTNIRFLLTQLEIQ